MEQTCRKGLFILYFILDFALLIWVFSYVSGHYEEVIPMLGGYSLKGIIIGLVSIVGFISVLVFDYLLLPLFLKEGRFLQLARLFIDKVFVFLALIWLAETFVDAFSQYVLVELAAIAFALGIFCFLEFRGMVALPLWCKGILIFLFGILPILWALALSWFGFNILSLQPPSFGGFWLQLGIWSIAQAWLCWDRMSAIFDYSHRYPTGFKA